MKDFSDVVVMGIVILVIFLLVSVVVFCFNGG